MFNITWIKEQKKTAIVEKAEWKMWLKEQKQAHTVSDSRTAKFDYIKKKNNNPGPEHDVTFSLLESGDHFFLVSRSSDQ